MKSTLRSAAMALSLLMIATACGSIDDGQSASAEGAAVDATDGDTQLLALGKSDLASRRRSEVSGHRWGSRHWMSDRRWKAQRSWASKRGRRDWTTTTATAPPEPTGSPTDGSEPSTSMSDGTGSPAGSSSSTTAVDGSTTATSPPTSHRSTTGSSTTAGGSPTTQGPTTTVGTTTTGRSSTTQRQTTTQAPTTSQSTTTTRSGGSSRFATLPPGASLPSGDWCAGQVRSAPETRSRNTSYNQTRGSGSNGRYPRVDGNFVGTTDEIIQWAACKWGIDEDWARAQAAKESWWDMSVGGDRTSDQSACHPDLRTSSGTCPESIGLMQVRYLYHQEAFANSDAIRSTAYNIDYAYAVWRSCYNGELTWLNDVDRGRQYAAGDLEGCLGVWFTGRWYVPGAPEYIEAVRALKNDRVWEQSSFINS